MAHDLLNGRHAEGDWSLGLGSDDPYFFYTPHDTNRIVDQAVTEEQEAVEEASGAKRDGKLDDATWRSFTGYHNEFHKWLASIGARPFGMTKLGLRGIYDTAKRHRERIADWRKQIAALGGKSAAPGGRGVEPPGQQDDKGGLWKWLAIAGGAVGGTLLIKDIILRR